jgi:hypothetical protein
MYKTLLLLHCHATGEHFKSLEGKYHIQSWKNLPGTKAVTYLPTLSVTSKTVL